MPYHPRALIPNRDLETVQAVIRSARAPDHLHDYPSPEDLYEIVGVPDNLRTFRVWEDAQAQMVAYAFVSTYNNFYFDIIPGVEAAPLLRELVSWGETCLEKRRAQTGQPHTLDASCLEDDVRRLELLETNGFERGDLRTLKFERALEIPVRHNPFPKGFSLRHTSGEEEAEAIVTLHRAAFGTDYLTLDERLAIMRAPNYDPALDLLAVAEDGTLAGYLTCSLEGTTGFTDPLAVHPKFQQRGLAKALLSAGLAALAERGAKRASLGTSSQNRAMIRVAEDMGFGITKVKLWLSKAAW